MTRRLLARPRVLRVCALLFARVFLGALLALLNLQSVRAQAPPGSFEPVTFRPGRGYFAQLPFEAIDMVSGNLALSFTDVALPGNGGMSLAVSRTMNYGGSATGPVWSIGLAGLPITIQGTAAPSSGPWTVGVSFTGGGSVPVAHQDGVDTYVLDNFMRVTLSTRTVELPNGWVATYETTAGVTEAELQEVHDAFGNAIHAYWLARTSGQTTATHINRLELTGGSDGVRTIYLNYDGSGTDVLSVQSEGRTWTYTYAPDHTLTTAAPPTGPAWQFDYSVNAMTVTTPNGGTVSYTFQNFSDTLGHTHPVVSSRALGGRSVPTGTWQFTFDRNSDPVLGRVDLPDGRRMEWQHHAVTGASGVTYWTLAHTALSRYGVDVTHSDYTYTTCSDPSVPMVAQFTNGQDGRTFTTTYAYHASYIQNCDFHRPYQITQSGELTRTTTQSFAYLSNVYRGDLVASTTTTSGSDSISTTYGYNAQGFVTSASSLGVQTQFAPDAAGNLASTTDPNGHATSFTYQWGAVKNTQTPLFTISRAINSDGSVASVTRHGSQTTFAYDGLGRVTSVTAPGRTAVTTAYNADTVVMTQGASVVTSQIDGFGRTTAVLSNSGLMQWVQYDALGQVILQSYPADGTTWAADGFSYDDLGRVGIVSHSGGGQVQIVYTGANLAVTDENNHTTTQHWASFSPGDGQLLSVTDPDSQVWQYGYNGFGQLKSVTQPDGSTRTFSYNARYQLAAETHPESGTTTYTYDDAGNLIRQQDANGTTLQFAYDANDRLVGIQGLGGDSVAKSYDDTNNRTVAANGAASTTLVYDEADRLATRIDTIAEHSFVSAYQYDGRDNLTRITYPSGRTVSYDYDVANRVTRVYDGGGNFASGIAYHPSGAISALTFGNGTTESSTFDGRYRLSQLTSGPLSVTYGYLGNNVSTITDNRPPFNNTFTYDALDRLLTVSGWIPNQFTYDHLGNRTWEANGNVTSTYDSQLRLTQASGTTGSATFTYDAVGNLLTETGASYSYTSFNMLRSATTNSIETSFGYDANNQRVIHSGATGTTYTIRGLGGLVLAEYEDPAVASAPVREYVYLGGKPIAMIGRAPSAAAASVSVALTAPAAGAVISAGAPMTLKAQPYVTSGSIAWVEFYANGNYLGAAMSAPYTLTVPAPLGTWNLQARALPVGGGVADSATVPVTVVAVNAPPAVSLTAPANNTFFGTGRTATLTASAADSDGIAKVEFYHGSFLLGTDTTAPYSFDWTNLQDGTYTVTARAYDALGATTDSAPVTITVQPIATITVSPASPTAGTAALVTVDGAAFCGSVNVYFGDGNMQTFMGSGLPISNAYAWASGGPKTITAVGLGGACNSQATSSITVLTPPSVSMTAPATGTTYVAPATVNLSATATAAQGAIARVDFYANGTLVGSSASAPYGVTWSNVPIGSYSVGAVATDTYGAVATSATIAVIVGTPEPPPSTVLGVTVSPNPGPAWQWATITVTGTNPCGMLYMDFGDGNWWIAPIDSLPYTTYHLWGTGTYTVTAAGYASCGGVATTSVTLTYGAPPPEPAPDASSRNDTTSTQNLEMAPADLEAIPPADKPRRDDAARDDDDTRRASAETDVNVIVDLNGTGSGTVTGSISCTGHATGCVGTVAAGATLTLTATPDAGVTWMGWSGACGGVSPTCTVTASNGLLIVANFRAATPMSVYYYHLDALGSVRAITDTAGATVERHDYRPFGEDTQPLPADGADSARFLGQPRDQTKLDLFGARYYSMFRGRFQSVDPGHADANLLVPQSFNAYAYARNNPFRFSDPSGLGCVPTDVNVCVSAPMPPAVPLIGIGGGDWPSFPYLDGSGGCEVIFAVGAGGIIGNCDSVIGGETGGGTTAGFQSPTGPSGPQEPQKPKKTPPEKPDPCKQAAPGTKPANCDALAQGLKNLQEKLKEPKCAELFGPQAQQVLASTTYRFSADFRSSEVVAITVDVHNVTINANGPFMGNFSGPGGAVQFGRNFTPGDFRGLSLGHELGHQTEKFPADAGNSKLELLNSPHTYAVMRGCYGG